MRLFWVLLVKVSTNILEIFNRIKKVIFQTKGIIPDTIGVIKANITNGRCKVIYNLLKNIDENLTKWIKVLCIEWKLKNNF